MKLFIDGGCSGNGQKDISKRKMVFVVADERNNILVEKKVDGGSNNIAEFLALREAAKYCVENKIERVEIITDSRNNLAWFAKRKWKQKQIKKMNDFERVVDIKRDIIGYSVFTDINLVWKPREENLAGNYIEKKYNL